ncbi:MAG: undecaprenyldiphospho-muramoylpentapeptide beta-N-acetylglucosaminyltransferase [Desulfatiglandaceae bacterium]
MKQRRIKPNERPFRCVIAGGGTGGHLFPGIAVVEELNTRLGHVDPLFIVGRRPMEAQILSTYGYRTQSIEVEGMTGRGLKKGFAVSAKLPKSFLQSLSVIRSFSPAVVLGVGGYSSGPFCLTARMMGIPTAIHEQNAYPGLTNLLLARVVDRIFISLDESRPYFDEAKTILTGNPVRHAFVFRQVQAKTKTEDFCVLVVGGSQGARAINQVFVAALQSLREEGRSLKVLHQTGTQDYERVKADYMHRGLSGDVFPFIDDMAAAYARADLVISRAGATTLFELAAMGKPSILVPYPFATHGHQEINAMSLVRVGGAEMVLQEDLTGERITSLVMKYMDDPAALHRMAECAQKMSRRDAASQIVDQLLEMAKYPRP